MFNLQYLLNFLRARTKKVGILWLLGCGVPCIGVFFHMKDLKNPEQRVPFRGGWKRGRRERFSARPAHILVDRRTREERRMGLQYLLDPRGRSAEDIRRDASEWRDELDRRYAADQRSAVDRRQQPDRHRDIVAATMTPAQISEAQKLAREWRLEKTMTRRWRRIRERWLPSMTGPM